MSAASADNAFDVFISYSRKDEALARALQEKLEAKKLKVFRDVVRLKTGDNVMEALPEALSASAAILVLWSEHAVASAWVRKEATVAWGTRRYLPLALPGFDRGTIPADFRDYNATAFETVVADLDALIAQIDRIKTRAAAAVEVENRMPTSGEYLVGRDKELAVLDTAWASGKTRLVVFDAMGGTGKTALINRFLANMADGGWRGAQRVYCWSFYSQGTDDKRQGDADGFFASALEWFGYTGEPITSADRRGRTLAALINKKKTLLVLDGLEPLQYPANSPGLEGKLKDDGLATLFKQLSQTMNGMAIVTTRIPIPELKHLTAPAVERRGLNQLETAHGVTLLKRMGVRAGETEIAAAVDLLKGHALSLNLLGSYSVNVLDRLLPTRAEINALLVSPEVGQEAHVMMRRYEILLEDRAKETKSGPEASAAGRQLALLYMIGLFDRPAERDALDVLKSAPIEGLTDGLTDLSPTQWGFAVAALRKLSLLLPEGQPGELDAHPLVREYFGERLKTAKPEAFKAANLRLYEHYKLKDIPGEFHDPVRYGLLALAAARGAETFQQWLGALMQGQFPEVMYYLLPPVLRGIAPGLLAGVLESLDDVSFNAAVARSQPATVRAMEPLFAAIAHGAAASECDKAFYEAYWPFICRGNSNFACAQLGAYGADLSALAHFFLVPFFVPSLNLAPPDQSLILGNAAFRLRALGRLVEAEPPFVEALRRVVEDQNWRHSSIHACNLSELRLALGKVLGPAGAVAAARDSVSYADASNVAFERRARRTTLANALHQSGDLVESRKLFEESEEIQIATEGKYPLLYSQGGFFYCDLLLSQGATDDVHARALKFFEWRLPSDPLLDIANDTLALAQARAGLGQMDDARADIELAIDGLRGAGSNDHIPRGLLARAQFHRTVGEYDLAAADLNEVAEIATRSHMRLFETDELLERARLVLARGDADATQTAASLAARAKVIIDETGYGRRIPDHALVAARVEARRGNAAAARTHLALAQKWIDDGWRCHVAEHAEISGLLGDHPAAAQPAAAFASMPAAPVKKSGWRRWFG